jgi:hypothetical protein
MRVAPGFRGSEQFIVRGQELHGSMRSIDVNDSILNSLQFRFNQQQWWEVDDNDIVTGRCFNIEEIKRMIKLSQL